MKRWTVLFGAVLLALTTPACGVAVDGRPDDSTLEAGPRQVVFRYFSGTGGMSPSYFKQGLQPDVTIYGSGEVYLAAAADAASFPGRPIAVRVGRVPMTSLRELVQKAATSGLFDGADYGEPRITDSGSATVTFRPGRARARTVSVYALSVPAADDGLTGEQQSNRRELRGFRQRLYEGIAPGSARAWTPDRVGVVEAYGRDDASDPPLTWTGPDLDALLTRTTSRGTRCGVLSGAAAVQAWTAARAGSTTHWREDGRDRFLVVRAMLPDERTC